MLYITPAEKAKPELYNPLKDSDKNVRINIMFIKAEERTGRRICQMENDKTMELGDILIYQTEKGDTRIDVFFQNDDIWMNQSALAKLYNTTPQNITMHIRNIYADGELDKFSTCKEFLQVQTEGKRKITKLSKGVSCPSFLDAAYFMKAKNLNIMKMQAHSIMTDNGKLSLNFDYGL